jgi:hypothetical protein
MRKLFFFQEGKQFLFVSLSLVFHPHFGCFLSLSKNLTGLNQSGHKKSNNESKHCLAYLAEFTLSRSKRKFQNDLNSHNNNNIQKFLFK